MERFLQHNCLGKNNNIIWIAVVDEILVLVSNWACSVAGEPRDPEIKCAQLLPHSPRCWKAIRPWEMNHVQTAQKRHSFLAPPESPFVFLRDFSERNAIMNLYRLLCLWFLICLSVWVDGCVFMVSVCVRVSVCVCVCLIACDNMFHSISCFLILCA